MRGLSDKTAIVTGAGSPIGIGFACAKRLAEEGARVLIADVAAGLAEQRAQELRSCGLEAIGIDQDVTAEADWEALIDRALKSWGRLDIMVNNAGVSLQCLLSEMSLELFSRQMEVNVNGVFLGCRAAMRQMQHQGSGGSIINMSSVAAMVTGPGSSAYAASKAAVNMLTKTLALEGAGSGIRANTVHPGVTNTEMIAGAVKNHPESISTMMNSIPLARPARAEEIAAMVAFLASEDASYCTGGSYVVDGGVLVQ